MLHWCKGPEENVFLARVNTKSYTTLVHVATVCRRQGLSVSGWQSLYTDLPSRQSKVAVKVGTQGWGGEIHWCRVLQCMYIL
jgi:hypothetical protein